VVEDTIELLKKLEREVKDLQRKFHEAELRKASHKNSKYRRRPDMPKAVDCNRNRNGVVIKRIGTYMKPVAIWTKPGTQLTKASGGTSTPARPSSDTQPVTHPLAGPRALVKTQVVVEFHVHLDNTKTVEETVLKCSCRVDYVKTMFNVVDEFQLDLTMCNIIKVSSYFICIMRLKVRTRM
jgi:hypothetical protein